MSDKPLDLTLVTALFDLGRDRIDLGLADYQRRSFADYLSSFERVLELDAPLSIYTEPSLADFVHARRGGRPTSLVVHELSALRTRFPFYETVQCIRRDPDWRSQASWLAESPQAALADYNPLVMSKLAMLNDQQIQDPFGTTHYLWIDAGLARTCGAYLSRDGWLRRISTLLDRFLFICFPYVGGGEVHGFDRDALANLAGVDYIRRVARGGLFGGSRARIAEANALYYRLMEVSLAQGRMGTEESLFSAMSYLRPELFDRFEIGANGLLGPFFDALLQPDPIRIVRTDAVLCGEVTAGPRVARASERAPRATEAVSTALYVLTFNQPRQLELLINSWRQQPEFLPPGAVFILDNSTDNEALQANRALCEREGFQHLAQGNIGICGGRQRAAELFDDSAFDYMLFLEDDMLLGSPNLAPCRSGMVRWVDGLHGKLIGIMEREGFDFLKLSFSEFYGCNNEQWAWFNVPPHVRRREWPDYPEPPGSPAARIPPVSLHRIGIHEGLAYASGEIYYCNWPQIVSREGNRKMFLDTRWAHPFEQTWMSHLFQLARDGTLHPAVLLASPIEHHREFHYGREERIES